MHFEYRGFKIECATTAGGAGFIGTVTIWQATADDEGRKVFTCDSPGSFPTQLQAVDYARVWAEMWCDEQLTPEWAARHATVQRRPTKKPKTTSRKSLGHQVLTWLRTQVDEAAIVAAAQRCASPGVKPYLSMVCRALGVTPPRYAVTRHATAEIGERHLASIYQILRRPPSSARAT